MTTPEGPAWTKQRLAWACRISLTADRTDLRLPVGVLATELGISARTVRRWVHAAGTDMPAMGTQRWERIRQLLTPPPSQTRQECLDSAYALEAITTITSPDPDDVASGWRTRRWLEPHLVSTVALPAVGVLQLAIARAEPDRVTPLKRRGDLTDFTVVPTKFHATLLANQVLSSLAGWRIQPHPQRLPTGRSRCWADDAPSLDLAAAATSLGVRAAPSLSPEPYAPGGTQRRRQRRNSPR